MPAPVPPPPPGRLTRWFFRVPLWLYRMGLGGCERLVGMHWLRLTTTGRRTGRPRTVMVDLLDYDPATGRYYVQPGWGRASDWVKNIEANPIVDIQDGRRRFRARAVDVSGPEGSEHAYRFMRKYPLARFLAKRMLGIEMPASEEALRAVLARDIMVLAFEPLGDAS